MEGTTADPQTLVVVGNGMMSYRLCRRLVECGAAPGPMRVVVFGEEPRPAYDRVHLTELFAGRSEEDLCLAPESWYEEHGIDLRLGDPVVAIDRDECEVRSAAGVTVPYDRLVLATGSRPLVPPIPGADLPGVFVYRTVDDLRAILIRARGAARAAVIGGGLLGLEAARAVHALGLSVHVVEAAARLMPRQLDETGANLLQDEIEALGVQVHTGVRTTRIEAAEQGLVLCSEERGRLAVDLVVLSAGICPRGELGRAAGLDVASGGGVVVDDHLATSDPRIFAVGECATHRGTTYGLAVPGYRMIDVLVDNLVGGDALFDRGDLSARLKLMGVSVAALGAYEEAEGTQAHTYLAGGVYRKLLVRDDRIVGALAVGEWSDLDRVREALAEPGVTSGAPPSSARSFSFWDLRRFRSTGTLWLRSESPPVHAWPADALVCGCLGVRRGALAEAEAEGCSTAGELSSRTGAGTMCGSCRPLLEDLARHARLDSLPPSGLERALDHEPGDTPPTLRCSPASPGHAAPRSLPVLASAVALEAAPRLSIPSLFPGLDDAAALEAAFEALPPPRAELDTLPCADFDLLLDDAGPFDGMPRPRRESLPVFTVETREARPELSPTFPFFLPSSEPPPSSRHLDSGAPSSRRGSMAPLRPISVPSSVISGLPSGRLLTPAPRSTAPARERFHVALLATAVAALGGSAAFVIVPAAAPARSLASARMEALWAHRTGEQATGYATLALALASLVLSLRKRWKRFTYGDVAGLRAAHGAIGAGALLALAAHTGLHLGVRLNRLLALDLLAAGALGGVAAAATVLGDPLAAQARRLLATRAHLYVLFPLPVLVALHVLGAYYF
jgi:NADPH-dependent 2,4-dienoyl-CoA reductase/sulfur reductase-like enzyme/bacterioferritin-associated ferredoxin